MPGISGLDVLQALRQDSPETKVIILTAHGTMEYATQCIKLGAWDFLTKPYEKNDLIQMVKNAINRDRKLTKSSHNTAQKDFRAFIGKSPIIQNIHKVIDKIASAPSTILISGESGTGKDVVAELIHQKSGFNGNFIKINCAAIPSELMESELFGYKKGAFTGADKDSPGKIEMAQNGNLFLDEISEIPLKLQAKLLHFLQDGFIQPVGADKGKKIQCRVIAATNKNLKEMAQEGQFREDLYFRLCVVPIHISPLRERPEDLEELIIFFCEKIGKKLEKEGIKINSNALNFLKNLKWPGNVRQLENSLERILLFNESGLISLGDLKFLMEESHDSNKSSIKGKSLKDISREASNKAEKEAIICELKESNGNITKTAENLGISRKGLQLKIKELGINKDQI